jgi:hypothetical protein
VLFFVISSPYQNTGSQLLEVPLPQPDFALRITRRQAGQSDDLSVEVRQ